jgi:outer membrane protein assembly factor BamB
MTRALIRRLVPVILLALVASALPPTALPAIATAQSDSIAVGPRGDAGLTGAMPGQGPAAQPSIQWEAPIADGVIMGMAIRNDLLFFATKNPGTFTAVNRASGAVAWSVDLGVDTTVFGPEVAGDLVVASVWAIDGNAIVALDAATGAERWRVATDNLPTAPTYLDGMVYVAAEGGFDADASLYALDATTGTLKWVFAAPEAKDLGERVAVSDGIVVASAWSLEDNGVGVYAIDAATGQVLWTFSGADELTMEPVVGNGVVLVTDLPTTWALDLRSGAMRWQHGGPSTGGGAAMDATAAYFGYGDEIRAVSLQDGSPLWSAPVSGIAGAPTVAEDVVYTAVWKRSEDPTNHWLHAFDAASGIEVWSLEIEHEVDGNQPLAHDGVLYVDTNSGVVAFGSGAPERGGTAPQGDVPATEGAAEGGSYTSAEFGHAITWRAPWQLSEPQSSAEPGQDFVTLSIGDASLAIRAVSGITSPEEMIRFYISRFGTSRAEWTVIDVAEAPDLSHATATYTVSGTSYREYVEVRPLPGGGGILLTILTAPADWFPLGWQAAQQLATVDQQPPFRNAPTG